MSITAKSFCAFILFAAVAALGAGTKFEPLPPEGQTFIHDPSTIVKDGDCFYIFGTGPGIRTKSSIDLIHWMNGPSVFSVPPAWTTQAVPGFLGYAWAPDLLRFNGKYYLYYSVSTFGKQVSAIGLATNPTLDPAATNYCWTDCGPVIQSKTKSPFNTIDPSVFLDADGKLWLAFGSYWQGIFLTELDPRTGLRISTNSPTYPLAWNRSIEAACLTHHGDFYYLFVNWGECCKGTNSTYEVRVGRAEKITGPYLDRDGKKLAEGGGSPFLQSSGRFIGPGHIGIVNDGTTNGPTRFSYHYYDAATHGRSRLALGMIDWPDGWPVAVDAATNDWQLVWHDEFDTNGPPDPANWNYEHGFVRNHELQWYQPKNAFCTNGMLVIEARTEHKPNPQFTPDSKGWQAGREWIDYTSASLTSRRLREFKYGRFEMRARIDTRLGSWPAFWTLGAMPGIPWPACGEVDIMEFFTGTVLANIGYGLDGKMKWASVKKPVAELGGDAWAKKFHIWTMEWDEKKIDLRLDDKLMNHLELATADNADHGNPFHSPVYFILNQAIGGDSGGDPSQTKFPIRFEVDWVRVYQRAIASPAPP
jgi:arabinan endo-1,5-alpha-L-arabinosidase